MSQLAGAGWGVTGRAVEQPAIGDDEGVVLLEDQHRVTAPSGVDDLTRDNDAGHEKIPRCLVSSTKTWLFPGGEPKPGVDSRRAARPGRWCAAPGTGHGRHSCLLREGGLSGP